MSTFYMSILINGMKIPTDGSMIFAIRPDGMVEDAMGCYVGKATPVPPHGRLIDAEELLFNIPAPIEDEYKYVRRIIETAPTIIPADPEEEEMK